MEHIPVMVEEVKRYLKPEKNKIILDCTINGGHHAEVILSTGAKIIGIDLDKSALSIAERRLLPKYKDNLLKLIWANFKDIDKLIDLSKIDGVLYDLGVSTYQLQDKSRGFSYQIDAPLDMRFNIYDNSIKNALEIISCFSYKKLCKTIYTYGEEKYARKIARIIVEHRKKERITTTQQLVQLIKHNLPKYYSWRREPLARVFQALRIAVNKELDNLSESLDKLIGLKKDATVVVISFHSLEDRIVKQKFSLFKKLNKAEILTKKPITPTKEEIERNNSARSAKLRAIRML